MCALVCDIVNADACTEGSAGGQLNPAGVLGAVSTGFGGLTIFLDMELRGKMSITLATVPIQWLREQVLTRIMRTELYRSRGRIIFVTNVRSVINFGCQISKFTKILKFFFSPQMQQIHQKAITLSKHRVITCVITTMLDSS